jgi:hypothetical protein
MMVAIEALLAKAGEGRLCGLAPAAVSAAMDEDLRRADSNTRSISDY